MRFDVGITHAIILSAENDYVPYIGSVGIRNGILESVTESAIAPQECEEYIDATGKILMPGLINGHCHGDMTLARGFGDDRTLLEQNEEFAEHAWFHRYITDEDRFFSRQLTYCEALLSGTTTIMENMFWSLGADSVRAAAETGIRAALAEDLRPSFSEPEKLLCADEIRSFGEHALTQGAIPALAGVSEEDYSPEQLRNERARILPTGYLETRHMAESAWRVERIKRLYGTTPIQFYHTHFGLHERLIASHMCYADATDIRLLQENDVKIVNTPLSEMKIADGIAPITAYLAAGITVGLGTDGALWNNTNDIFREMKGIALLHAATSGIRSVSAKQALNMATIDGARVFGLEDTIGTVEEGKAADIILLDASVPHMSPLRIGAHENVGSSVVFNATGRDVTDVFIKGKRIVKDRVVTTVSVKEIVARVQAASNRISKELRR